MTTIVNVPTAPLTEAPKVSDKALLEAAKKAPPSIFQDGYCVIYIPENAAWGYVDPTTEQAYDLRLANMSNRNVSFARAMRRSFMEDMTNVGALSEAQKAKKESKGVDWAAEIVAKRGIKFQSYLNGEYDDRAPGAPPMTREEKLRRDTLDTMLKEWADKKRAKKGMGNYKLPTGDDLVEFRNQYYELNKAKVDKIVADTIAKLDEHPITEDTDDALEALLEKQAQAKAEAEAAEEAEALAAWLALVAEAEAEDAARTEAQAQGDTPQAEAEAPEAPAKGKGKDKNRKAA